jgi:hypothetical protein
LTGIVRQFKPCKKAGGDVVKNNLVFDTNQQSGFLIGNVVASRMPIPRRQPRLIALDPKRPKRHEKRRQMPRALPAWMPEADQWCL